MNLFCTDVFVGWKRRNSSLTITIEWRHLHLISIVHHCHHSSLKVLLLLLLIELLPHLSSELLVDLVGSLFQFLIVVLFLYLVKRVEVFILILLVQLHELSRVCTILNPCDTEQLRALTSDKSVQFEEDLTTCLKLKILGLWLCFYSHSQKIEIVFFLE